MAIGDTWETINTYAFVAGETIITADYENDVVNNLEYLYTHPSSAVNIYHGSTNTDVTVGASTNDVLAGLVLTFTPVQDKVMLIITYSADRNWTQGAGTYGINIGYKVNSGAITYIAQDHGSGSSGAHPGVIQDVATVTAGSSNTITMYVKNIETSSKYLYYVRVIAIEMAN